MNEKTRRRAIGIVRVSQVGERKGDRFASPAEQRARIAQLCEREGLTLLTTHDELDVSGGAPLAKRPGLRQAVEEIEAGRAECVVVAYFDRLVRSIRVQEEVVSRIEAAGGGVLAADIGEVTQKSAAQWMTSGLLGMIGEYLRRSTGERTADAQRSAVESGRAPHRLIPGYRRAADGTVELDPETAPIVKRAWEMRAEGASYHEIRRYYAEHGITRASLNTLAMGFKSRMVLGEINWRGWKGTCPRLIDDELWERVQTTAGAPRGRYGKSERLLARAGVLRCAVCGGRMSATMKSAKRKNGSRHVYPFYRCAAVACHSATIGASLVEGLVTQEVMRLAGAQRGTASRAAQARVLREVAEKAQDALDRAIRTLAGMEDEPAAVERIRELRLKRDEARIAAEVAEGSASVVDISIERDWDDLCLAERQALVQALIDHVSVAPGRGPGKVRIVPTAPVL